jgi:PAS domain S-box-containing protein
LGFLAVPIVSEVKRRAVEQLVLQQTEVQAGTATIAIVDRIQDVLHSAETTAAFLARDLEDRDLTPAEVDRLLRNILASNQNITECSLSTEPRTEAGNERFGQYARRGRGGLTLRDLAGAGYRYWERPWYGEAIGRGGPGWSEPFFDQGGADANVIRLAAPFYHSLNGRRTAAGVITVGFDLDWVKELARSYDFFETGYVIIFSHDGRVIAHPNPAYVFRETMESLAQKFNLPELASIHQRVLAKRQGSLSYWSSIFTQRVHENYKPAQVAGWGVVVGYAESEFLQPVNRIRWLTIGSLVATMLLLAIIVLLVIQFRLRPLRALTEVSAEIGRGNLDCEIAPPRRDDEIGRLGRSFIVMREVLQENRALELKVHEHAAGLAVTNEKLRGEILERRWTNQALEHQLRYNQLIIDSISEAVFVLTKVMNISRINPAVVQLTGFESGKLVNVPLARLVRLESSAGPVADPMLQALKNGQDIRDQPAVVEVRDGTSIPVRLSLFPLRDRDKVVGGVVILRKTNLG